MGEPTAFTYCYWGRGYPAPDFNGSAASTGHAFTFRADGWFNMTKAAAHFGKRVDHFLANRETLEYIEALSQIPGKSGNWIDTNRGRYGGTWAHPKLTVFFARWLDVRFAVWCDAAIEDILKGAAELVVVNRE